MALRLLSDSEIDRAVAATWAHRARQEREATARFARISQRAHALGVHPGVVERAAAASRDEAHHAVLCEDTARRFGWTAVLPADARAAEIAPSEATPRERVLYDIVAACCVSESVNAALLSETLAVVKRPEVHHVVREILRDEVEHARLGWGALALAGKESERVSAWLPRILEGTVTDELFLEGAAGDEDSRLRDAGNLPRAERARIFTDAMTEVVLPGFEHLGVDTVAARDWLARRKALPRA